MLNISRRSFIVNASRQAAWEHVTYLAGWPSWASRIRSVEVDQDGELRPGTRCLVRYKTGISTTFEVVAVEPGRGFTWAGKLLWLRMVAEHRFEDADDNTTRMTFAMEMEGFAAPLVGRIVAAICGGNVQRSIPRLVMEINAYKGTDPAAAYRAVLAAN